MNIKVLTFSILEWIFLIVLSQIDGEPIAHSTPILIFVGILAGQWHFKRSLNLQDSVRMYVHIHGCTYA